MGAVDRSAAAAIGAGGPRCLETAHLAAGVVHANRPRLTVVAGDDGTGRADSLGVQRRAVTHRTVGVSDARKPGEKYAVEVGPRAATRSVASGIAGLDGGRAEKEVLHGLVRVIDNGAGGAAASAAAVLIGPAGFVAKVLTDPVVDAHRAWFAQRRFGAVTSTEWWDECRSLGWL